MSGLWDTTYDYPVPVAQSDTTDDPSGPFAGLLTTAAGTLIVWPNAGPQGSLPISILVLAGQYIRFPVRRVGASSSTCVGLVSGIVRQGPKTL